MGNSWECDEWQVCGVRAIESRKTGGGDLWWWEGSSPGLDSWQDSFLEIMNHDEVGKLMLWCSENNLVLNTRTTKELIVDFRKFKANPLPIIINRDYVERVRCFAFLGIYLSPGPQIQQQLLERHSRVCISCESWGKPSIITGGILPLFHRECFNILSYGVVCGIVKDSSHPGHHLFSLPPSWRRYRSIKIRTARFSNSFYPRDIQSLN